MKDFKFPTFTGLEDLEDEMVRKSHTAKVYLAMEVGSIIVAIPEECWGNYKPQEILVSIEWHGWVFMVAEHPKFVHERYVAAHDQWYEKENGVKLN